MDGVAGALFLQELKRVIENPLLRNQAEWLQNRETIYPFDNIMPQVINDLFYRTNASVFTGRVSPEDAANELQREYEDILAQQ